MQYFALLTDFGSKDPYVGIMKGVIGREITNPIFIDISHEIEPFAILAASYVLYSAWDWMPEGTVFLSVVDPGVGTERRELLSFTDGKALVCPDNGTLSLLWRMKKDLACYRVSDRLLQSLRENRPPFSRTFDGRDLFAPVAACIGSLPTADRTHDIPGADRDRDGVPTGTRPGMVSVRGEAVEPVLLPEAFCSVTSSTGPGRNRLTLDGWIMHVDHFGNCITSIHYSDVAGSEDTAEESRVGRVERIGRQDFQRRSSTDQHLYRDRPSTDQKGSQRRPPATQRFYRNRPSATQNVHQSRQDSLFRLDVNGEVFTAPSLNANFSLVEPGHPILYWGSAGFLEVAVREGSASERYGIRSRDGVELVVSE